MAKTASNRIGAGDIQDLAVAVEQLTEETRILRQSLDELRDDVVWAARQVLSAGDALVPAPGLCRPRDPLAPDADFAPSVATPSSPPHGPPAETAESGDYCCASPRLTWTGDSDAPGIECRSCGYLVAEMGQLVCWRSDEDASHAPEFSTPQSGSPAPITPRQGNLFRDDAEQ